MQIIEPGFVVVVVATITEGVYEGGVVGVGDGAAGGALDGESLAPRVIFVVGNVGQGFVAIAISIPAVERHNVALNVLGIDVVIPHARGSLKLEADGGIVLVIAEDQYPGWGSRGGECVTFLGQQQVAQPVINGTVAGINW